MMEEKNKLDELASLIAEEMVARIYGIDGVTRQASKYYFRAPNPADDLVGELARLMTLSALYEQREEYEQCTIIQTFIDEINESLNKIDA